MKKSIVSVIDSDYLSLWDCVNELFQKSVHLYKVLRMILVIFRFALEDSFLNVDVLLVVYLNDRLLALTFYLKIILG